MGRRKKDQPAHVETKTFTVKKCPYCYTYVAVKDGQCKSCGKRIGPVDRGGWARKVLDWKAYTGALVAIVLFVAFYWWAFVLN